MSLNFKVFTLNCWGLKVISSDRKARISAIAERLSSPLNEFDVVCLQEVWTNFDFNFLRKKLANKLPYAHYFYSGVVGSGVCILSKHFIEETFFHQWSVNGYIHKLQHGDWWGGKGVGLCRLKVQNEIDSYSVNVYTTHLHAEYNCTSDDYLAHRVLQAYDTAQFIMLTSSSADLIVLAGDLNTEPGHLAYRVMLTIPGLIDAYMQAGNISEEGFATCESLRNSYTPKCLLKEKVIGRRIDYVLYHPGANIKVDLKSYQLPLADRVPGQCFSYSDHEAILVELLITKDTKSNKNLPDEEAKKIVLEEGITLCKEALENISRTKLLYWIGVFLLLIFIILSLIIPVILEIEIFGNCATLFAVFRVFLTGILVFCFLMATLWSRIEMHGVLSGKLAMEVSLRKL